VAIEDMQTFQRDVRERWYVLTNDYSFPFRWYSKKSIQINKKWYLLMKCHCMDLPPPTAREAFDGEVKAQG
jgi:hypothetical protein